jgi:hypothetical protein
VELLRALAVLAEPPCPEHTAIADALALSPPPSADEHTDVLAFQVYPYASVYLGAEGMLGGEARDRIAGFWRALGAEPPPEPDHASVLCAALAALAEAETRSGGDPRFRGARVALYWEHVASWMPPFLAALRRIGSPFYVRWAELLDATLAAEADALGEPPTLPLALRAVPPPSGPPGDLDELLQTLLAPARVGFVITRDDLARCAGERGLGLRVGERRFALRGLLAQDGPGVLGWLADEARRQASGYMDRGAVPRWWQTRAIDGAHWLDRLSREAATAAERAD